MNLFWKRINLITRNIITVNQSKIFDDCKTKRETILEKGKINLALKKFNKNYFKILKIYVFYDFSLSK